MAHTTYSSKRRVAPGALGSLRANPASPWRHVDVVLLGSVLAVAALGCLMVFSSTRGRNPDSFDTYFLQRQLVFVTAGAVLMVLTTLVDYRRYRDLVPVIYGGAVALLVLVISPVGSERKGAQRWFDLGGFQLQPAEIAKIAVIVSLAAVLAHFGQELDLRRLAFALAVPGVPFVLFMLQPDLGSALVFVTISMGALLIGGARVRHIAILTVVGLIGVGAVLSSGMLEEYQQCRLTSFLERQEESCEGGTYNQDQSLVAIGSGGVFGTGVFQGTQTRLDIVPEQHTDFIFTAVGEELGFVGSATLLALLSIITWRIWRTAQLARDPFGTLICVGVLCLFVFQVFENVGMAMGIMPVTGIPLPFMSYGGSATLASFILMGLVLNVHMRRFT
jgi:rod shape determining protein RodA